MPVELRLTSTITPATQAALAPPAHPQSNVLSRLQALFPASASTVDAAVPHRPRATSSSHTAQPKVLKVRIVTWNMHDSLPKGDLEELLGTVPPYEPQPLLEEPTWPYLSADGSHPYHLVVVAGQECPSISGIPMGLGAGFKLGDHKEREKENIKEKDKSEKHKSRLKDDDDSFYDLYASSGWTSILEDWLCNGVGCVAHAKVRGAPVGPPSPGLQHLPVDRTPAKEPGKGPYQPLIKHRMMGLSLAVYIHRDLRSLVRGTSKSAVTTGLIGGRVGNKGGLGVSLNIDGTTILLINAHLAAHERKVPHRLANLAKIKAELSVDDFLNAKDPRMMAEDLTDKFDYTFLCGDLNFRLDISRLHADFLISRQEYAQALAFDQLRNLMQNGLAFVGFKEGPINFAPTFKYDVLRTLKRAKTKSFRPQWKHRAEKHNSLHGLEEPDGDDDDEGDEEEEGEEGASMASSNWTSVHSKLTDLDDEDVFGSAPSSPAAGIPTLAHRVSITAAAHKAKTKWKALVSPPSGPGTPISKWLRPKHNSAENSTLNFKEVTPARPAERSSTPDRTRKSISPEPGGYSLLRPPMLSHSTKSVQQSGDEDTEDEDKGVYDSSNKKRVPSWCDRILWKSTVQPNPDPEELLDPYRPRTRMGQFFVNAFRPLSHRGRRESLSSLNSSEVSHPPLKSTPNTYSSPTESQPQDAEQGPTRFITRSRSNEVLTASHNAFQVSPSTSPPRGSLQHHNIRLRRSLSADLSAPSRVVLSTPSSDKLSSSDSNHTDIPPPVPPKDTISNPPRWRFFPFINRDPSRSSIEPVEPTHPRKGDVVCLTYNTLDDRGMRRLEGRSDHRPVIGSYAIYL